MISYGLSFDCWNLVSICFHVTDKFVSRKSVFVWYFGEPKSDCVIIFIQLNWILIDLQPEKSISRRNTHTHPIYKINLNKFNWRFNWINRFTLMHSSVVFFFFKRSNKWREEKKLPTTARFFLVFFPTCFIFVSFVYDIWRIVKRRCMCI